MPYPFAPLRWLTVAILLALGSRAVWADTHYDPASNRITIDSIVVGEHRYNQVQASLGQVLSLGGSAATRSYDSFDPATGVLTVASITVAGSSYFDVQVTLAALLSYSGGAPITDWLPNDPLFKDQWHLQNTGQTGRDQIAGKPGADLNVARAWNFVSGTGIQIAIVDDGIDAHHQDLRLVPGKSWNYLTNSYADSSATLTAHGTACAGLAAAIGNNGIGVAGVAYNAHLVGYNLLQASEDLYGADAMTRDLADNHVYSNSYGAADNTGLFDPSSAAWQRAIDHGINNGRSGKGVVYTWAAGNGAPEDRSDYDGQANYQGVLAIGSLNDQGQRSSYSEAGSNLLVMAYGGEYCDGHTLSTTDVTGTAGDNDGRFSRDDYPGQPNYTRCMNGTSAAAPQAAGVVALLLEANPALGWRDVRAILAASARQNDPSDPDWVRNAAGHWVNDHYGYGAINASAAVAAAQNWQQLPAQKTASAVANRMLPLALTDQGQASTSDLTLSGSGITQLEFVDVFVTSDHPEVGDLRISLTSPSGTVSTLTVAHDCRDERGAIVACADAFANGVRFGVARLMGEAADGNWTLSLRDERAGNSGSLLAWSIKVYGY